MKTLVLGFILLFAGPVFGQTPPDKLTPDETREAHRLARTFARRLLHTKDLTPLVDEYFARNFIDGYLQCNNQRWLLDLDPKLATEVSRAELRRYLIAELNWFYLCELYVFSKHPSSSNLEMPPEKMFPADVLRIFRSDPNLKFMVDVQKDDAPMISTVERLRTFVENLERTTVLLRGYARRINAGHTRQYRETLSDWADHFELYKPWLESDDDCLTAPKGTRVISVTVPSFELHLSKVNGRMRIISAWFLID